MSIAARSRDYRNIKISSKAMCKSKVKTGTYALQNIYFQAVADAYIHI